MTYSHQLISNDHNKQRAVMDKLKKSIPDRKTCDVLLSDAIHKFNLESEIAAIDGITELGLVYELLFVDGTTRRTNSYILPFQASHKSISSMIKKNRK